MVEETALSKSVLEYVMDEVAAIGQQDAGRGSTWGCARFHAESFNFPQLMSGWPVQDTLKLIEDKLLGVSSIPSQIRNERKFDKASFLELEIALLKAIDHYKNERAVPKSLALCFVDVSNGFYVQAGHFSSEEQEAVEDAGMRLSELGQLLFSI